MILQLANTYQIQIIDAFIKQGLSYSNTLNQTFNCLFNVWDRSVVQIRSFILVIQWVFPILSPTDNNYLRPHNFHKKQNLNKSQKQKNNMLLVCVVMSEEI